MKPEPTSPFFWAVQFSVSDDDVIWVYLYQRSNIIASTNDDMYHVFNAFSFWVFQLNNNDQIIIPIYKGIQPGSFPIHINHSLFSINVLQDALDLSLSSHNGEKYKRLQSIAEKIKTSYPESWFLEQILHQCLPI